jgi:hypothetical protein
LPFGQQVRHVPARAPTTIASPAAAGLGWNCRYARYWGTLIVVAKEDVVRRDRCDHAFKSFASLARNCATVPLHNLTHRLSSYRQMALWPPQIGAANTALFAISFLSKYTALIVPRSGCDPPECVVPFQLRGRHPLIDAKRVRQQSDSHRIQTRGELVRPRCDKEQSATTFQTLYRRGAEKISPRAKIDPATTTSALNSTLANFDWAHQGCETLNIRSFSTISCALFNISFMRPMLPNSSSDL